MKLPRVTGREVVRALEPLQHPVGDLHVVAGMDALIALVAIPAGHLECCRLVFVGYRHRRNAALHRRTRFRANRSSHLPCQGTGGSRSGL